MSAPATPSFRVGENFNSDSGSSSSELISVWFPTESSTWVGNYLKQVEQSRCYQSDCHSVPFGESYWSLRKEKSHSLTHAMLVRDDMFKLLGTCVVFSRQQREGRAPVISIPLSEVRICTNWAENLWNRKERANNWERTFSAPLWVSTSCISTGLKILAPFMCDLCHNKGQDEFLVVELLDLMYDKV